ncbi:MAG: UDP-N-acetylmuramoyl-L-alanine--D-glutamate ligase [Verrucomicrobiota bacterium]|nr:UDP-N-acetylmuramoyl-L-alanine--D-glutamate ligase [Verrucomicrobiota bacterium]
MRYTDRKVAVLGAGLSGTAAAHLLRDEGAAVSVLDSAEEKTILKTTIDGLRARGIEVICGPEAERNSGIYEIVVLSPGIDPASPLAQNFSKRNVEIIGELELGWRSCNLPVIAVTGTNGKTTTTELLAQMLNACGQKTIACGNIGKPLSEVAREGRDLDVLTVEVSSFQLETITTFKPNIAVWLNFAPDHLDRYRSLGEYRAAKLRIFDFQTADDVAIINSAESLPALKARTVTFSAYDDRADFWLSEGAIVYHGESVLRLSETKLRGSHNLENLMATLAVGLSRGLSFAQMVPPLCEYEPRPHRLEFVRELGGVTYVNDSKATNLHAVEKALLAQTKPVVLVAGGKDKGFEYDTLTPLVRQKVRATVLIGEMAQRICRDWSDAVPCEIAVSIAAAVERAHAVAKSGEVVLFSPGTSSFDMFKSYADRGDQFRALVHALKE